MRSTFLIRGFLLFAALSLPTAARSADTVAAPTFSVGRGTYETPQSVDITSGTPGAAIRYTTNCDWPSAVHGAGGTETVSVTISTTTVLRAVAYLAGMEPSSGRLR